MNTEPIQAKQRRRKCHKKPNTTHKKPTPDGRIFKGKFLKDRLAIAKSRKWTHCLVLEPTANSISKFDTLRKDVLKRNLQSDEKIRRIPFTPFEDFLEKPSELRLLQVDLTGWTSRESNDFLRSAQDAVEEFTSYQKKFKMYFSGPTTSFIHRHNFDISCEGLPNEAYLKFSNAIIGKYLQRMRPDRPFPENCLSDEVFTHDNPKYGTSLMHTLPRLCIATSSVELTEVQEEVLISWARDQSLLLHLGLMEFETKVLLKKAPKVSKNVPQVGYQRNVQARRVDNSTLRGSGLMWIKGGVDHTTLWNVPTPCPSPGGSRKSNSKRRNIRRRRSSSTFGSSRGSSSSRSISNRRKTRRRRAGSSRRSSSSSSSSSCSSSNNSSRNNSPPSKAQPTNQPEAQLALPVPQSPQPLEQPELRAFPSRSDHSTTKSDLRQTSRLLKEATVLQKRHPRNPDEDQSDDEEYFGNIKEDFLKKLKF